MVRENGSIPVRYGILSGSDDRIKDVKSKLSSLISPVSSPTEEEEEQLPQTALISPDNLILTEIRGSRFLHIFSSNQKVKGAFSSRPIYAYEVSDASSISNTQTTQEDVTDQQIKRILTSAKNPSPIQKPDVVNQNQTHTHSRQSSYNSLGGYADDSSSFRYGFLLKVCSS